jgi:hypothetical protein
LNKNLPNPACPPQKLNQKDLRLHPLPHLEASAKQFQDPPALFISHPR